MLGGGGHGATVPGLEGRELQFEALRALAGGLELLLVVQLLLPEGLRPHPVQPCGGERRELGGGEMAGAREGGGDKFPGGFGLGSP